MINHQAEISQGQIDRILNAAIEKEALGLLNWNIKAGTLAFVERITGYSPEEIHNVDDFVETVIEERDQKTILRLFKMYKRAQPKELEITMRIRSKDGKFKQVLFKSELDSDAQSYYGILYDVTSMTYKGTPKISRQMIGYRLFLTRVRNLIATKKGTHSKGALLGLSINNYKTLISNYNMNTTEEVMRSFINLILSRLKPADELSRFSDELYFIWINEYEDVKDLQDFIHYILNEARQDILVENMQISLQLSMGVTLCPENGYKVNNLIKYTDFVLMQSQEQEWNQCLFFDTELSAAYHRHKSIEKALPFAVKNDELSVHYQPQIDPTNSQIVGVEALVRWYHPVLGNIPPNDFIELAERKGDIHQIGYWVLEEVLKTTKGWLDKGYHFSTISINISPLQIERESFRTELLDLCKKYQMPTNIIELEVTEGTLLERVDANVNKIKMLRQDGFQIALDDFGTGYSNFSYILHFPITSVKIDRSMIENITQERDFKILSGVVALAKSLNYQIVIEGVETIDQLNKVKELDCDRVQGFFYSQAVTQEAMGEMLVESL